MIWTRWVVVTQLVVAEWLSPTLVCCQLAISKMSISGIAQLRLRAKISPCRGSMKTQKFFRWESGTECIIYGLERINQL